MKANGTRWGWQIPVFGTSGLQIRWCGETKRLTILLLSLLTVKLAFCQTSTLYKCNDEFNKGFLCISNDTLSFFSTIGGYYYGSYYLQDSIIIPFDNLMEDRCCTIQEEPCDSSCMEIAFSYWEYPWFSTYDESQKDLLFIDTAWRIFVCYDSLQYKESVNDGIVSFCNDELEELGDSMTVTAHVYLSIMRAKTTLPIKTGVRYRLMQKQYKMYPWVKDAPWLNPLIYYKKDKQQIVFYYGESFSLIYDIEGTCHSCFEELRRQFPKL